MILYKSRSGRKVEIWYGNRYLVIDRVYPTADEQLIEVLNKYVLSGRLIRVKPVTRMVNDYVPETGDNKLEGLSSKVEGVVPPSATPSVHAEANIKAEEDLDKLLKENENQPHADEDNKIVECEFGNMRRADLNALARAKGFTGTTVGGQAKVDELIAFIKSATSGNSE